MRGAHRILGLPVLLTLAGPLPAQVRISEIMYHPPEPVLEFIELHNAGATAVSLAGWSITGGVVWTFPGGSRIEAGGFALVCRSCRDMAQALGVQEETLYGDYEGALSNGGERVALSNAGGQLVDEVEYSDLPPFDPLADGLGRSLERLCFLAGGSAPGNWRASAAAGGTPRGPGPAETCPPPLPPALSPVVLSEIYYHPPDAADPAEEFLELYNRTGAPVDLHGWRLADGVDLVFDRAMGPTVVPPGGMLLVAGDPAAVSRLTGIAATSIAGPWEGRLSNFEDVLELQSPDGTPLERVAYSQDGLWPARADGLGSSLQIVDPNVSSALPQNWRVAADDRCSPQQSCVLVTNGSSVRWFENLSGGDPGFSGGRAWFDPDFNDVSNGWRDGRLAVGYDSRVPDGQPWVLTPSTPLDGAHSILLRIEFQFDPQANPCATDAPFLSADWDDGFVAWLNGVEVARRGMLDPAGTVPAFDGQYRAAIVTAGGYRQPAPVYQNVWAGASGSLRAGRNVLAIGNYNSRNTSSDLYLSARLTLGPEVLGRDMTPGQPSAVSSAVVPPLVRDAEHSPAEPRSTDAVIVTAGVEGPEIDRVDLVVDSGSGETTIPMRDDGAGGDAAAADGVYTGRIDPLPSLTLVKYRVEAWAGGGGSCPGSQPREGNPSATTGYLVADGRPAVTGEVRLFYIFTPGALTDLSCTDLVYRGGTLVDFRGRAHFDVGVKFRGETACSYPKKPLRVRFNRGDTLDAQRHLNFNACWNDKAMLREKLGFDLFRDAGVPYSETHMARVHTNGGVFHGAYFTVEDPSEEYLRRNGWDSGGGLWKCRTPMLDGSTGGYEALTDPATARIGEVGTFATALNARSGQALVDLLDAQLDVEEVIDYQAVQVIIIDGDSVVKNWLLYLGPHGADRLGPESFGIFPWDIDLSFGQMYLVEDVRHHDIHPLFQTQTYPFVGQGHHGIINALLQRAPDDYYVKAYYGRMWTLLQEKFRPDLFLAKIDAYDESTIETVRADLQQWPRTWGARGTDPDWWRDDLRAWARRRYDWLTAYLVANNPTTGGRRFQYTPAPRLKFTEVHYNPDNGEEHEFLELANLETTSVDLSGWTIPAVDYEFPPGSIAPAGGHFVVARAPALLRLAYEIPPDVPVFGPYFGDLDNGGEELRLRDSGQYGGKRYYPETIDVVRYDDDPPWPTAPDGRGESLELRGAGLDNDEPASWQASRVYGGTPGLGFLSNLPPVVEVSATPTWGMAPLRVQFDASRSFDPEGDPFTVHWDFGDGFIGAGALVARTFTVPGTYQVTVTLRAERGPSASAVVEIRVVEDVPGALFVRGDVSADGSVDILDPIRILLALFCGGALDCRRAADIDDDGDLRVTDAVLLLGFLFQRAAPPREPYPECGPAPSAGLLDCSSFLPCGR